MLVVVLRSEIRINAVRLQSVLRTDVITYYSFCIVCVLDIVIKQISIMGNIIYSILWFVILIFFALWVAGISAGFYIILHPLTVCIEPLSGLTDFLLTVIQFPKYCAQAMVDGRGFR